MAYCGPRGIPLDAFLGWPEASQHAALEWVAHEAHRCPSCGSHPDEPPRHVHFDECPGCTALSYARESPLMGVRGAHTRMVTGTAVECGRCNPALRGA